MEGAVWLLIKLLLCMVLLVVMKATVRVRRGYDLNPSAGGEVVMATANDRTRAKPKTGKIILRLIDRMPCRAAFSAAWSAMIQMAAKTAIAPSAGACDLPSIVAGTLPAIARMTVVRLPSASTTRPLALSRARCGADSCGSTVTRFCRERLNSIDSNQGGPRSMTVWMPSTTRGVLRARYVHQTDV